MTPVADSGVRAGVPTGAMVVRGAGRELAALLRSARVSMRALSRPVLLLLAAVGVGVWRHWPRLSWPAALLLAVILVWPRVWPSGFTRLVTGRRLRRRLRSSWADVAQACGLGVRSRTGDGEVVRVPRVVSLAVSWPVASMVVDVLAGQVVGDVEGALDRLTTALGAVHGRVEVCGPARVRLSFTMADLLVTPVRASVPASSASVMPPSSLPLGITDMGTPWRAALGPHTLVAGATGSGKGSVLWSFMLALAPAIRVGTVRVHGVDLKGGMELLMGAGLLTSLSLTAEDAVDMLDAQVEQMTERARTMGGKHRSHTPSVDEPLTVVLVDELAALTAYISDRTVQRRAEQALSLLLSQGRAPGFVVWAFLQDPRKEVIPVRGLFTQMIGLRLKDANETVMVLGEHAVETAPCHRISRLLPGVGYVVPEDGTPPIRVRASYVDDDTIRAVAHDFPAPALRPTLLGADSVAVVDDPPPRADAASDGRVGDVLAEDSFGGGGQGAGRPARKRSPRQSTRVAGGDAA